MGILLLIVIFIVQLLKYWILIVTFMDGEIKRRWVAVVGLVCYILLSLNEQTRENETHLKMYLIVLIITIITIKVKRKNKISVILMSLLVISCADEVFELPMKYGWSQYEGRISVNNLILFSTSLIILTFFIVLAMIKRKTKIFENDRFKELVRNSMPILMLILAVFIALTIGGLNYAKEYVHKDRYTLFANGISVISFISIVFLAWFMIYINNANIKMEELLELERNLKEMELKYYEEMLKKEEGTRKYRHDMNNHLICLNQLVKEEKWDSMADYVGKLQNQMNEIHQKIYIVGNEILDAILNYHLLLLDEKIRIILVGRCQKKLNISNVDLCTIFADLIQNAVEELKKESTNEKYLKIIIKSGVDYLKLEISNSISDKSLEKDNFFKTNKSDKSNHGLGLLNVRCTVEKNSGSFNTKVLNNEFIASVILKQ